MHEHNNSWMERYLSITNMIIIIRDMKINNIYLETLIKTLRSKCARC